MISEGVRPCSRGGPLPTRSGRSLPPGAMVKGVRRRRRGPRLSPGVADDPIHGSDKVKWRRRRTVSRNSAAPCHIHKASCTGNKAVAALDGNTLERIECSGRLECTVNFVAVGGYHHKLTRNRDRGAWRRAGNEFDAFLFRPRPLSEDAARPPTPSLYWKACILQWGQDWLGRGTPHERVNSRPLPNSSFHYSKPEQRL